MRQRRWECRRCKGSAAATVSLKAKPRSLGDIARRGRIYVAGAQPAAAASRGSTSQLLQGHKHTYISLLARIHTSIFQTFSFSFPSIFHIFHIFLSISRHFAMSPSPRARPHARRHAHTSTHAGTHARSRMHTHPRTHPHTGTHIHTHTHTPDSRATHTHPPTHARAHAPTHPPPHTHTETHRHTDTHTHRDAHTHPHTHTRARTRSHAPHTHPPTHRFWVCSLGLASLRSCPGDAGDAGDAGDVAGSCLPHDVLLQL